MAERNKLFDIQGRVIVVTGASSGIGRSLAQALAARGARLACIARRRDRLDTLVDDIVKSGDEAIAITCDVTDQASVRAMVDTTERKLGPIDVLVNNAGISIPKPVLDISLEEWDRVIGTNLGAAFMVAQEVGKRMATRGRGSIINISSIAAYRSFALAPAYGAAKAGLNNLTETMAVVLAEKGVRVNGIAPGVFNSELGDNYAKRHPEHRARGLERVPMRRVGEHEELVGPVVLLASDASSYMTGSTLIVDGGATFAR